MKAVKITKGSNIIDDGTLHEGILYNAEFKFKITNGNGNNKLSRRERIYLYVKGKGGKVYETPSDGYTIDELRVWADERAKELLEAIYASDPLQTTSGVSNSVSSTQNVTETVISNSKKGVKYEKKEKELLSITYMSDVKLDSEKGNLKNYINNIKFSGKSKGTRFNWEKSISNNKSIGLLVAYKSVDMDDYWNSRTKALSLIPNLS